jgi:hypothetical protein
VVFGKQPFCLLERGCKVRLGLDHHSVWVDRAGVFAHLVPDVKARLGILILFAEIGKVHPQPQAARALLERDDAGIWKGRARGFSAVSRNHCWKTLRQLLSDCLNGPASDAL